MPIILSVTTQRENLLGSTHGRCSHLHDDAVDSPENIERREELKDVRVHGDEIADVRGGAAFQLEENLRDTWRVHARHVEEIPCGAFGRACAAGARTLNLELCIGLTDANAQSVMSVVI